jgi:hypothetical protein
MVPALAIVWCSGPFWERASGGIVIEGRVLIGLNRIGGEWGHNPLPWATENERPGHRCYCGKYGCIETFLSGAGLMREYFSLSQKEFPAEQIAAAEEAGEPSAVRSLAMYKRRLARSLAALVNILDPDGWRHLEHKPFIRRTTRVDWAARFLRWNKDNDRASCTWRL